jgi:iron complex outermembrane receptor protein
VFIELVSRKEPRRVIRRPLHRILAPTLLLLVLGASRKASADERTEARAHFKRGMALIVEGQYGAGIEELKKAYDTRPHPNVLYNIARAYVDEGDLENAVIYYRKYLESNPSDGEEVAQIVATLEARIRRQQADLLEIQRARPVSEPTTPGGPPGTPGSGSQEAPAAPSRSESATARARPAAPEAAVPGQLKTEEVFEETIVTASKAAQSPLDAPNSTSIITEQDIRLSGITKIPELLRRLAGVDLMEMSGSQSEVSLRGFNQRFSNKVIVLVDGRSVFIDFLGVTLWATLSISVDDIDRIEVVRGPGSALYGADAFNGVINIITKQAGQGGSGVNVGYGDLNTTHATVYTSGRASDLGYRVSAGYDYLPRWSREVPSGRDDAALGTSDQTTSQRTVRLDTTVTRHFGNASARLQAGYSTGSTEVFGIGAVNDIVLGPFEAGDITAAVTSKHIEARVYGSQFRGNYAVDAAYIGQTTEPASVIDSVVDAEVQYVDHFGGGDLNDDLRVGLGYRYKGLTWSYEARDEIENHASLFVHDELRLSRHLAFVGDYRADYVPYLNRIVQSPRASILFHPSRKSTVRAIAGTAFRTPTFLESFLNLPVNLPVAGGLLLAQGQPSTNPNFRLNPEQIFTTEVGYLNSDSDYFTFDSALFFSHAENLIELAPNYSLSVGDLTNTKVPTSLDPQTGLYPIFLEGFENQCQTYNVYGAELGLRVFPVEGLDLYANTTLMDVKQDNSLCSAAQLALIANDSRTSKVKVNTGVQLRTRFGLDGSVDFHYVSSQVWAEQVEDAPKQRIDYEAFPLPTYELLDASVGFQIPRTRATLRGVAFNLLNEGHREHPFGQYVGRRLMAFFSYKF